MIESAGGEREIAEFELVLNWFQELNRLVPIDPRRSRGPNVSRAAPRRFGPERLLVRQD